MKTIKITAILLLLCFNNLLAQTANQETENQDEENITAFFASGDKENIRQIIIEIHRDKTIEIGDRITFQLSKDMTINNVDYPVGTDVYAYTSLNKLGRVMLDIQNIEGNPIKVKKVEDYNDHLEGLYFGSISSRKKKKEDSYNFMNGYKVILNILEN